MVSVLPAEGRITATGTARIFNGDKASARNQALKNAQRSALEQGLGVYVDSTTVAENWRVIQDKIFSSTQGYVSRYDVIDDRISDDGKDWLVTIDAEIADGILEDDLRALNILHRKTGDLFYAVDYSANSTRGISAELLETASTAISDRFGKSGFRLQAIPNGRAFRKLPLKKKFEVLLTANVQVYVEFELVNLGSGPSGNPSVSAMTYKVRIKAYDISTERILSQSESAQRYFTRSSRLRSNRLAEQAAAVQRSASVAVEATIRDILRDYGQTADSGRGYVIIFQNYDASEEAIILKRLLAMNGYENHREIKKIPGLLSLSYTSRLDLGDIRNRLSRLVAEDGLSLQVKVSFGNRLVFVKH